MNTSVSVCLVAYRYMLTGRTKDSHNLRRKCPYAPHHIAITAVKAISTFLQPPSVFNDFLSTALTVDEIFLTHYSDHYAAESFNSSAGRHSGFR